MILEILYYFTIRPLEILFETIFYVSYRFIGKPLATIIALSVFVNILVFPLYKRADKLQAEQREREKAMEKRLTHIKKTFNGDEKVMMTQAYYRISDYKPVYALRGASSLLLQIPFFIAAYRFLSGVSLLNGMPSILIRSFHDPSSALFLIKDLGAPDMMLPVGDIRINVLPVLMTMINIVSGTIYSKGHLLKEKIQLYVTALVFLILLYNSPSGLVIYWTFNNLFSLLKNVVQKIIDKKKENSGISVSDNSANEKKTTGDDKYSGKLYDRIFLSCALFMALLTGLFIPSNVLASSATEFINSVDVFNPSHYLIYSFLLSAGFFVVWTGIYYLFSGRRARKYFSCFMSMVSVSALVSFMMSGSGLGTISSDLKYDAKPVFSLKIILVNLALIALVSAISALCFRLKPVIMSVLSFSGCAAVICMSSINVLNIGKEYDEYVDLLEASEAYSLIPEIKLSRTERNVVVLMLDRAMGPMIVYAVNERPDLVKIFDGFTYYHDTISFADCTNIAMPAVFGGYEYAPHEMNKQEDRSLEDKTNEALKVLPALFYNNGYEVTVMDPPYAGYSETPDLSIYDDYPGMNTYISCNKFNERSEDMAAISREKKKRNLYYFGFMKSVPVVLQNLMYDDGNYNSDYKKASASYGDDEVHAFDNGSDNGQVVSDLDHAVGLNYDFLEWYSVLENLTEITTIEDNDCGEFLMMYNCAPHEPMILQLPDYVPAYKVDNSAFDMDHFYTINGDTMYLDDETRRGTYHVDMACLLRLGEWFDYLREEGVYDNTRIIIVADHGRSLDWFRGFKFGKYNLSAERFLPLFMVKDFDSHGFTVSTELMSNADACILAVSGDVVEDAVNPFTGNALDGHEKQEDVMWITNSNIWDIKKNNGNKFLPDDWYTVHGTPYDLDGWEYLGHE